MMMLNAACWLVSNGIIDLDSMSAKIPTENFSDEASLLSREPLAAAPIAILHDRVAEESTGGASEVDAPRRGGARETPNPVGIEQQLDHLAHSARPDVGSCRRGRQHRHSKEVVGGWGGSLGGHHLKTPQSTPFGGDGCPPPAPNHSHH